MKIRLIKSTEYAIADDSNFGNDVVNRPVRDIFTASGLDITEDFGGFAKKDHTHTVSDIFGTKISTVFEFTNVVTLSIADGTAPLSVTSTTKIDNLNADLLDGKEASEFALVSTTLAGYGITDVYTKDETYSQGEVDTLISEIDVGSSVLPYPDEPPASPHAANDEFNSATLDAKWTVVTALTAPNSYDINTTVPGWLIGKFSNSTGPTLEIRQALASTIAAGVAYSCTAKVSTAGQANYGGIVITAQDSTAGTNRIYLASQYASGHTVNYGKRVSGVDTFTVGQVNTTLAGMYIHFQRDTSNVWRFFYSDDGVSWFKLGTTDVTLAFIISHISLTVTGPSVSNSYFRCGIDWLRVNWLTL